MRDDRPLPQKRQVTVGGAEPGDEVPLARSCRLFLLASVSSALVASAVVSLPALTDIYARDVCPLPSLPVGGHRFLHS